MTADIDRSIRANDRTRHAIADKVEAFVREVIPYEKDPAVRRMGPSDELVQEMRAKARKAGVLTPHILPDGSHLTQRETAIVLIKLRPVAARPGRLQHDGARRGQYVPARQGRHREQKERFLEPLVSGEVRSAFFMTEPAAEGGAGSDPSMMKTTAGSTAIIGSSTAARPSSPARRAPRSGSSWRSRKTAPACSSSTCPTPRSASSACSIRSTARCRAAMRSSTIDNLRVPADQMLGASGEGFKYAQIRLWPARLSHCMRWLGAARARNEIATDYACRRHAFGKPLIDHEGVGFMLADNLIDLKQAELMIDWCADVLDTGRWHGRKLDGEGRGVRGAVPGRRSLRAGDGRHRGLRDTIVEQVFREIRAFRIYDGPTEVHKWSLAKKIKRDWKAGQR